MKIIILLTTFLTLTAVQQASCQACSSGTCLAGFFHDQNNTSAVTTSDGCTTWAGMLDGWTVTHGAPIQVLNGYGGEAPPKNFCSYYGIHLLHEYGGNPDYPNATGGSGIKINYNFAAGTTYSIRVLFLYNIQYYPVSSYPQQGWLKLYLGQATSGIPAGNLAACRQAIPSASASLIYAFPLTSTSETAYDLVINYPAVVSGNSLWIYPEGYDKYPGQSSNPQVDIYLSNVFICPACPSGTVYLHSGTPGLSINVATIYAGTSTIDEGSGTGTISNQPTGVSSWTASKIELDPGFIGTASGSGSLTLTANPCTTLAGDNRPDEFDNANLMTSAGAPSIQTIAAEATPQLEQKDLTAITGDTTQSPTPSVPSGLLVYPTVNNGSFTISGSPHDLSNAVVLVSDQTGQIIYKTYNEATTSISINLNNLSEGLYFVEIRQADRITTRKIIVTK